MMLKLRCYLPGLLVAAASALPQGDDGLLACGEAFYYADKVSIYIRSVEVMRVHTNDLFQVHLLRR